MQLLSPYRLGSIALENRVVMAPMTRSRAIGGEPNALMRDYYAQRAGAGLIITEGVAPTPDALGYARIPGLFSEAQVVGWRAVTDAVHAAGGKIFAQLMHVGRIAHPANLPAGARIVAPSAVAAVGNMWTDAQGLQPLPVPKALDATSLVEARESFVSASRNAIAAGFDGVELHGANGYLLEQFLNPHTNLRSDDYGGSVEARARFVIETVAGVAAAIGKDRVGLRLSPHNTYNGQAPYDDVLAQYLAVARGVRGIAYLHLVATPDPAAAATRAAIRATFEGPIILNGGLDQASAEAAITSGLAELASFGRPFIANPDFVRRMQRGTPLAAPNPATFYTPGPEGYLDYPAAT